MTLGPRARKFTLTLHITISVAWIGAVAAYIALDVATTSNQEPQALRSAYAGMALIAGNVIVPLAVGSLISGLVISLGTKWGLFRHYWVVMSLVLTAIATAVLLVEMQTINHLAQIAADPATSSDELRALSSTLPHSIGGTLVLLVVLVLNMYKPKGMTRYGWRKERERRVAAGRQILG